MDYPRTGPHHRKTGNQPGSALPRAVSWPRIENCFTSKTIRRQQKIRRQLFFEVRKKNDVTVQVLGLRKFRFEKTL